MRLIGIPLVECKCYEIMKRRRRECRSVSVRIILSLFSLFPFGVH